MSISALQWVKWARIFKITPHVSSNNADKIFRQPTIVEFDPQKYGARRRSFAVHSTLQKRPIFFSSFFSGHATSENHLIGPDYERQINEAEAVNKSKPVQARL